jgi:dTDP-4-dehydrorhamnose reductase
MKLKILLTGKNGQLGTVLQKVLSQVGDVIAVGRQQLDLASPGDIRRVVREIQPRLIVNAAAYTAVDGAEKEEAAAIAVNRNAPAVLAEEAKRSGAALVHYSTDYVFDGIKRAPYDEDDPPNPLNVYGATKLAGELAIRESGVPHLIFRTAWVYGREGHNFLLTILNLATQREELRIVSDQIGVPTSSREIAAATIQILAQLCTQPSNRDLWRSLSGIYHMTASGETSRFGFASAILEEAALVDRSAPWIAGAIGNNALIAKQIIPIRTSDHPTVARRPSYSVLSNTRLARTFGIQMPDWRAQLHLLLFSSE